MEVGLRDARYSFFHLRDSHDRLRDHVRSVEAGVQGWRDGVDGRAQTLSDGIQRNYLEYVRRTAWLERLTVGAVLVAVVEVVVALYPYFAPRG